MDNIDCSSIVVDEGVPYFKFWISILQLFKSDEYDLLIGNELSDAVITAAQHLLKQRFTAINGFQSPILGQMLNSNHSSRTPYNLTVTELILFAGV